MKVTMRNVTTLLSTLALATTLTAQTLPQTERQYLSGHGCDDTVEWVGWAFTVSGSVTLGTP